MSALEADLPADGGDAAPDGAPRPVQRLRTRAITSALWSGGGFGGIIGLRLGTNILLAQVLLAEDFGLMGLVFVVMAGLEMFSDLGIGSALVQSDRNDRTFVDTAWTLQVLRGLILWVAAAAIGHPVAVLLDAPQLAQLLPVVGFVAVIRGLQSTNWFSVMRELSLRGRVLIELATFAVNAAVMVGWAYGIEASVWALVAGGLASGIFQTVLSHTLPGGWNRFRLDRQAAGELLRFGGWLFLSTILSFLAMNLDKVMLKVFTDLQTFGVFYVAWSLSLLGTQLAERITSQVGFPMLSKMHRERPEEFARVQTRARLAVLAPIGAMMIALMAFGPSLFYALYPLGYWGAGWIVQVLSFRGDDLAGDADLRILRAGPGGHRTEVPSHAVPARGGGAECGCRLADRRRHRLCDRARGRSPGSVSGGRHPSPAGRGRSVASGRAVLRDRGCAHVGCPCFLGRGGAGKHSGGG